MHLNKSLKIISIIFFVITNLVLFLISLKIYTGNKLIFFLFFIIINSYVFYSFRKSELFLDKTLSIFIWLGFFYKLSILLITDTNFPEGGGNFNYSPIDYDELLLYSTTGIISILLSSISYNYLIINFIQFDIKKRKQEILFQYYREKKFIIQLLFLLLTVIIFIINSYFGYYQKGLLPKYEINPYLGYIIKWLLLFGLTSISCLLIEYDLKIYKKISIFVISLFFIELFLSNLSLLSRALIFTGGAVLFSTYYNYGDNIEKKNYKSSFEVNVILLLIIFIISIFPVNKLRNTNVIDQNFIANKILKNYKNSNQNSIKDKNLKKQIYKESNSHNNFKSILQTDVDDQTKIEMIENNLKKTNNHILSLNKNFERILFLIKNRFIGLDAVAAVSSYPDKSISLIHSSLKEKFDQEKYGFYQRIFVIPYEQPHLIDKKYENSSKRHYGIIIPGIIGYLSYAGSKLFLFSSLALIYIFCSSVEIVSRKLSFNSIIFSNFVGYILAYRLIHFGYLPSQSYLLIAAIFLTIIIIYILKKFIILYYEQRKSL